MAIGELSTSYLETSWDKSSLEFLKTNPITDALEIYPSSSLRSPGITHNEFSILLPEHIYQLTRKELMRWRLQDSTQNLSSKSNAGYREQPKQDFRYESNHYAYSCIQEGYQKRGIPVHHSQDEKYFEAFKRNVLVTATTHSCEEVLDLDDMTGYDDDSQELFQQKQYFVYSVSNKVLQSDMGKNIVRKHAPTLDAQSVWKEFETHMSTSSKGLNKRHRLHSYVSTTVYDRSWKGPSIEPSFLGCTCLIPS